MLDFQYGFSLPLDLGLGPGSRSSEPLPLERPVEPLVRWKCAFEVKPNEVESFEADDHERSGDRVFCLVGGPTWSSQSESGKITGEGAEPANLNTTEWMEDLFDVLEAATKLSAEKKAGARRLAACWYNVAMAVSFEKVNEEDEMPLTKGDVMAMLMGGMSLGDGQDDEDMDEEEQEFQEEGADTANGASGADYATSRRGTFLSHKLIHILQPTSSENTLVFTLLFTSPRPALSFPQFLSSNPFLLIPLFRTRCSTHGRTTRWRHG